MGARPAKKHAGLLVVSSERRAPVAADEAWRGEGKRKKTGGRTELEEKRREEKAESCERGEGEEGTRETEEEGGREAAGSGSEREEEAEEEEEGEEEGSTGGVEASLCVSVAHHDWQPH